MDDKVYSRIKNYVGISKMIGNDSGIGYEFMQNIIIAVEKGNDELTLSVNKGGKK